MYVFRVVDESRVDEGIDRFLNVPRFLGSAILDVGADAEVSSFTVVDARKASEAFADIVGVRSRGGTRLIGETVGVTLAGRATLGTGLDADDGSETVVGATGDELLAGDGLLAVVVPLVGVLCALQLLEPLPPRILVLGVLVLIVVRLGGRSRVRFAVGAS